MSFIKHMRIKYVLFLILLSITNKLVANDKGSISYADLVNKKVIVEKVEGIKNGKELSYKLNSGKSITFIQRPNVYALTRTKPAKVSAKNFRNTVKSQFSSDFKILKEKGDKYTFIEMANNNNVKNLSQDMILLDQTISSITPVLYFPAESDDIILLPKINIKTIEGTSKESLDSLLQQPYFIDLISHYKKTPLTESHYSISLLGKTFIDASVIFSLLNKLSAHSIIEWAEPEFVHFPKKQFMPNDPQFLDQWHLNNTGQNGALPNTDINAVSGWDIASGSDMLIAIYDDGFDLSHPDLSFWTNPGESGGGKESNNIDDDNNGYIDDHQGWDFGPADNDPSGVFDDDNHGTAVAGVAAAQGDNGIGVVGSAYQADIIPLRLDFEQGTTCSDDANAIRYGGMYADVVTNSWSGPMSCSNVMDAAINDVVNGLIPNSRRGKKGAPVLFAAGNGASATVDNSGAWYEFTITGLSAGPHVFEWKYSKDGSLLLGDDTVWVDNITWPDSTIDTFNAAADGSLPSPYTTSGDANWEVVSDAIHSFGGKSLKAGSITDSQETTLTVNRTTVAGNMSFSVWVSSEYNYDFFEFFVDGILAYQSAGDGSSFSTSVSYPAASPNAIAVGASDDGWTGVELRSSYSQYGPLLDFLAPSDGGINGITTTDYTGNRGYDTTSDYIPDFGGTSSATPLAAGVVANILQTNPELSASQARNILKTTAEKITGLNNQYSYDNIGRNQETGFGRIDMLAALQQSQNTFPSRVMKRGEIAKPLLQMIEGITYIPPASSGALTDVPASIPFADWIEELYDRGISTGCAPSRFCPDMILTKEQISKLILRTFHYNTNQNYTPPQAIGNVFDDVSTATYAANWIEELRNSDDLSYPDGFTEGCNSQRFCPKEALTWESLDEIISKIY